MHYMGRQGWIILEGIRIRLDYAASRDYKRWILYIGRSRGGAGTQLIQAIYRHSRWFKRQTGQDRHFSLPHKGSLEQ